MADRRREVGTSPEDLLRLIFQGGADAAVRRLTSAAGVNIGGKRVTLRPPDEDPEQSWDNPMEEEWDLIVGGVDGAPVRFPKGTSGQMIRMSVTGTFEWMDEEDVGSLGTYEFPVFAYGEPVVLNDGTPVTVERST
jgi:hypothetical protein